MSFYYCTSCGCECMLLEKCRKCGWCTYCCNCWINKLNDDFFNTTKHSRNRFIPNKHTITKVFFNNKSKWSDWFKQKKYECARGNFSFANLDFCNTKPTKVYCYDFSTSTNGHYSRIRTIQLNFCNRAKALWKNCLFHLFKLKK